MYHLCWDWRPGKVTSWQQIDALGRTLVKFLNQWKLHFHQNKAFRFNVEQGLQGYSLADFENFGTVEAATKSYLDMIDTADKLVRCVKGLNNDGMFPRTSSSQQGRQTGPLAIEGVQNNNLPSQHWWNPGVEDNEEAERMYQTQ